MLKRSILHLSLVSYFHWRTCKKGPFFFVFLFFFPIFIDEFARKFGFFSFFLPFSYFQGGIWQAVFFFLLRCVRLIYLFIFSLFLLSTYPFHRPFSMPCLTSVMHVTLSITGTPLHLVECQVSFVEKANSEATRHAKFPPVYTRISHARLLQVFRTLGYCTSMDFARWGIVYISKQL